MSADQRAWHVTGAVRRLLLRAVLVLGGAFAVTLAGWLLCAASAHADMLPSVPSAPSVPAVLSLASSNVDVAALPQKKLGDLSTSDVAAIGRHAHSAVTGASEWVAPSVAPAADVLPSGDLVPFTTKVDPAGRQRSEQQGAVTKTAAYPLAQLAAHLSPTPVSRQSFATVVQRRHQPEDAALAHRAGSAPSPVDTAHVPALPPLQPAGSSDSSVHGGGGGSGGSGGMQIPFAHPLGTGFVMTGPSSTPRPTAGPGRQPGTSPD